MKRKGEILPNQQPHPFTKNKNWNKDAQKKSRKVETEKQRRKNQESVIYL